MGPGLEIIKPIFMLKSAEHEFTNAHKHETKFSIFSGSDKPKIVGILTFMNRKPSRAQLS